MNRIKLHNWALVFPPTDPYQAPETIPPLFHGNVEGHPNHNDGKSVTTSIPKFKITNKEGLLLVVTGSGSVYELCEPDKKYIELFPDAVEKIKEKLNSFPEYQK